MNKTTASCIILAVVLLVGLHFSTQYFRNASHISPQQADAATVQDLYALENAINAYYDSHQSSNHEAVLPTGLDALPAPRLQHQLTDYFYDFRDSESFGGPTVTYTLCASFQTASEPSDDYSGSIGGSPNAYAEHRKGYQCYQNNFYKSGSHVAPIN